ncbi:Autophagy-related protein 2 [Penicillium thymicola]|uniref:Autophagy-related protein 2 n=1 Tax=Penicillium thymicola TaxID=293382 RepID=A0AAI9TD12_PENTH|nr:Autophagy-related protein 2 [Penicillium thymicola]
MASYFMPSFFQKQLLKYALSRLGLVDTDALDPDNLGIRWGQRSTIELKDIGLKLEKLSTLLNLPPSCELLSARVQLLRITLPADFHNSGILCEANGIDVHIRLLSEEPKRGQHTKGKGEKDDYLAVPTPSGLAESFLESEPKEEREELQAAISSQSQVLPHDPLAWSTDDDNELGLGNETLSLPSFVAGFLKGVVDRLQLKIKDAVVRVDMELKQDGTSKRHPEHKPDHVAGLLSVGEVNVHAVTEKPAGLEEGIPFREGKRLISIADINVGLVSDPSVFSNYSRFAAPASPSTTMQSKGSQPSSRAPSPSPLDSSEEETEETLAMTQSTIFEPPQAFGHSSTTTDNLEGSAFSHGRFSDADSDSGSHRGGYMEDSQIFGDDPFQDNPGYLDSVIDTQFDDFDDEQSPVIHHQEDRETGSEWRSQLSRGRQSLYQSQQVEYSDGPLIPSDSYHMSQNYGTHNSQIGSGIDEITPPIQHYNDYNENEHNEISQLSVSSHHSSTSPPRSKPDSTGSREKTPTADLNESQLFSHDEAQSLYMSVISQDASESFMPQMPGAWGSFGGASNSQSAFDDRSKNTAPIELAQSTQVQDEANSRYTVPSEDNVTEKRALDDQAQSQTFHEDSPSTLSSPGLHRINEMRKSVLTVDKILIWLSPPDSEEVSAEPSPVSQKENADSDLNESTVSFGDFAPEESLLASRAYKSTRFGRDFVEERAQSTAETELPEIAVEVFSVSVHFDIATGWLLTKIGQKLSQALGTAGKDLSEKQPRKDQPARTPPVHLVVHAFSIKFIERVSGHVYSSDNGGSPLSPPYSMEDVILRLTLSGLDARVSAQSTNTKLNLHVSKFAFGFASEDIVFFDERLKMRESTRDVLSPSQGDISISLVKSADLAKVDISTLPLHINLNVQRLEEVLGGMGGLSTILELGSSMSSVSTVKGGPPPSKQRPRGVHFETPAPAVDTTKDKPAPWKVNARVGAILLNVTGETHCLQLTTTAVKIVSRFEGIGIQIDKAKMIGPLAIDDASSDTPAKITLNNIRLEFLFAPKEVDLDRLLTLITPSQDKFEVEDDIMLDTLLRQRRQGSVLRVTVGRLETVISDTGGLEPLSSLAVELGRLSNVTKYLPEDDRPGILTLMMVRDFQGRIHVGGEVGDIECQLTDVEVAHITMPSLTAAQIGTMAVMRNNDEELVGHALWPPNKYRDPDQSYPPVLMARFIPDEMDPTYKFKLHNLLVEYTVPSVTAFLGLGGDKMSGDLASSMVNSVANLAEHSIPSSSMTGRTMSNESGSSTKPVKLAVVFRDCVLGLNPRNSPAKALAVLTNAKFEGSIHGEESAEASLDIRKASLMIIDDVYHEGADNLHQRGSVVPQDTQAQAYIHKGYVPVSSISSATAGVKLTGAEDGTKSLDVELRDDLLILETCADSTQTLISIMNGLQPPTPPNVNIKYRTEIMPIQDMFASFTGDAFAAEAPLSSDDDLATIPEGSSKEDQLLDELEYVSDFYPAKGGLGGVSIEGMEAGSNDLLDSFHSQYQVSSSMTELDFQEDHFAKKSAVGGTAHRWDSTQNTYGFTNDTKLERSPLRVRVRDVHFIWNLFDGYDWQRTRDTISKAVKDVETKATERRSRGSRMSPLAEDEEESVIGDFLFNSIYIGIPANKDPRELHREINQDIDDFTSETGSYATTTTVTGAGSRQGRSTSKREKKLRLHRSKHHKMTFELKGVSADLIVFPPGSEETQSSLDVRVKDLEIYDHVPTSTWKKFATYMREAGEKESGTSMVHLEVLTVKPVPELAASEIVLKATILPLRLHVDQDALDFMSRFFEFRDATAEPSDTPGDVPFLQRVEINAVQVKLDFKPKRVDYAGLRSGRTTEFMNFFVLDGADMVLRHVIIYGVSGFDRMGQTLNDIWMPDVKQNQLPGVLAGLAPIRSLVNVGGGVRDLVVVPMREYQKDGRIVRSIQKGALAFAKTTSNELVKLGAKLAIGTQTVLQGAEDMLTTPSAPAYDDDSLDEDEAKKISLYADQPVGVVQGLRGAFSGLERDLLLARDAIVAVPGEVVESGSAKAAAKAVWKRAPTVILRPAIGVSKAVGQTLLGAGNTLDPSNRRKMEDKYKRY